MKQPSFLFGTIHLICKGDIIWTEAMKRSLHSSEEVCFELDMDDPSVLIGAATAMISKDGSMLKDYFSPEDYTLVEKFAEDSLGWDLATLQQMKPAALHLLFSAHAIPCKDPNSYESMILEEAQKLKLAVTGLEEPSEQISLFDRMHSDSISKEIVEMARDFSGERSEYRKLLEAYELQDLPQLFQLIAESKISGEDRNAFVDNRNKKWISIMEGRMEQRPVFFAVGAGHLWGENGIIQLLRKSGYTVLPVK